VGGGGLCINKVRRMEGFMSFEEKSTVTTNFFIR